MPVEVHKDTSKGELRINVSGRFDFGMNQEFRKVSEQDSVGIKSIVIDLGRTEYMDSSALGMLLVLRDKVAGSQAVIRIVNASPEVKKILQIANFDKLFTLV